MAIFNRYTYAKVSQVRK